MRQVCRRREPPEANQSLDQHSKSTLLSVKSGCYLSFFSVGAEIEEDLCSKSNVHKQLTLDVNGSNNGTPERDETALTRHFITTPIKDTEMKSSTDMRKAQAVKPGVTRTVSSQVRRRVIGYLGDSRAATDCMVGTKGSLETVSTLDTEFASSEANLRTEPDFLKRNHQEVRQMLQQGE